MNLRFFLRQFLPFWKKARGPHPQTGSDTYVDPTAQFLGASRVVIGSRCAIGEDCWFNVNHRQAAGPAILIGDSCFIGRRNFLTAASEILLGDYVLTGTDCHFLGANHSYADPLTPYVLSEVPSEEPIVIGTNCWLGSSVTVLRGVRIGHGAIIGAGSVVTRSIPPFSIAVGNPAGVRRRFDFQKRKWIPLSEWHDGLEKVLPDEESYRQMIREKHPRVYVPAIACSAGLGNL